jgi:hypothetical protein
MRGMKPLGVLLVGVALALSACYRSTESGPTTETGGQTTETSSTTIEPDARTVAVYSAVVRQLVTKDHTFGGEESPFDRVFIVARTDPKANSPYTHPLDGPRLTAGVQAAILHELSDLPPVRFVDDPDSVIVGEKRCAHVRGNGVLITLGPISGGPRRLAVPNRMFFACLGGQWLTYVLERSDGDWQVVGTRGPVAIS